MTEIHDTAGAVSLDRSPSPGLQAHWLGHLPSLISLLYKKKTSGKEVRRTLDVKLRFVGFIRLVGFNFGHIQLLMFVIVMFRSYSFGHLESVSDYSSLNTSTFIDGSISVRVAVFG